mmetsp:Transcript_24776/g.32368  ORF Transcript_24776/g.32368 Transcript_24776/m.32368 type:complete len:345 (+) Transcript_24776:50-1084(+)|eukprot:CAMPEP_0117742000 /NCGR_PEP_ID=MMETSP0947-20121206/5274_1 /TAXON_ID=44440 /ORGANISM="Chattonella subsalsa, Strain CCMP2191" /LENGTH=344 /DNA_ID=CAMNT_0005558417 /DNA_START=53 /DNA_END=1087 /DNA_ORIENTATION=+
MVKNSAFVFVKPHAVTDATKELVKQKLTDFGLQITGEGTKTAQEIESKQLIDNHYYAIASKATLLKPSQLNVPADKFKAQFGIEWKNALASNKVFNAKDACSKLGLDADGLNKLWADCKKNKKLVKFGGGFYCGEVQPDVYVFNGFFMTMRSAYVAAGASIHWFTVTWDEEELSWEDFRGKVLGPTDPATAPADSVRGTIYSQWKELGLPSKPDTGNNGVHASASPFEAFAERKNWLGASVNEDEYGKMLLSAGLDLKTINEFCLDPSVPDPAAEGKKGSLWDQLEDTNTSDCLRLCVLFSLLEKPVAAAAVVEKKSSSVSLVLALCIGAAGGFLLAKTCLKKL